MSGTFNSSATKASSITTGRLSSELGREERALRNRIILLLRSPDDKVAEELHEQPIPASRPKIGLASQLGDSRGLELPAADMWSTALVPLCRIDMALRVLASSGAIRHLVETNVLQRSPFHVDVANRYDALHDGLNARPQLFG